MRGTFRVFEKFIHVFVYCVLSVAIIVFLISLLNSNGKYKANTGSFKCATINDGWVLETSSGKSVVSLPVIADAKDGEFVTITNVLPKKLSDGMNLLFRSSMQDVYIYVNNELRAEYSSGMFEPSLYYLPSTYFTARISEADSGKPIMIKIKIKSVNKIGDIRIGYGNNAWYSIITESAPSAITTLVVLAMGVCLSIIALILRNIQNNVLSNVKAAFYLGLLMVDTGIWIIGESKIKPLIFKSPYLSHFFVYTTVSIIVIFASMYFNEVQKGRHRKLYIFVEAGASLQCFINLVLQFSSIKEFYETLILSHIFTFIGILVAAITIIMDIKSKAIKDYMISSVGLIAFTIMSFLEISAFYFTKSYSFGVYICIGLIILMITTVIELIVNEVKKSDFQSKEQTRMIVSTVETIASAIDARDKYTGGHSSRVGRYAAIIARAMAADYDFSEEDIVRIEYIGLMHDIGKIGVADNVLNKAGKLTDEEYSLMKKHVDIGYGLLSSMEKSIDGLLDGVRYHHEKFDGTGYPDGLSDTDIPLVARILCIADCYDAMTSNRVYRKRLSDEEVKAEFIRCSGTQFDPGITEICIKLLDEGTLRPYTDKGMEINVEGNVPDSSYLEYRLQQDSLKDESLILNPAHVRMLCYVAKLMEKQGQSVKIFFTGSKDSQESVNEKLLTTIKEVIKGHDLSIQYTKDTFVIALFDKGESSVGSVKEKLINAGGYFTPIGSFVS